MSIRDNYMKAGFGTNMPEKTSDYSSNIYKDYGKALYNSYGTAPTVNIGGYQTMLNYARDVYQTNGVKDPEGAVKKQIVGSMLNEMFPQYTREQATAYSSKIFKQATGYDVAEDKIFDLFAGAFSSAAANFYTGYRSLEFAAAKGSLSDEEYQAARDEYLKDIQNTYKTYYNKEANEKAGSLIGDIVYNMGNAAPSMIPGLLISAATTLASGGAGAPSASIMLWNALRKGGASYTAKQIGLGVTGSVLRTASSVMMEAGSVSTELLENNVDPDIIVRMGVLTGVIAGGAEELGSDIMWGQFDKWLNNLRNTVGQRALTKTWKTSIKEVLKEGFFDTLKSGISEGSTEMLQEPTELAFTKHAYKLMAERGNEDFEELAGCSIKEYVSTGMQAFGGAFMGQIGFGFLRTGATAAVSSGSIRKYNSASKISYSQDADSIIKVNNIDFFGSSNKDEAGTAKPVKVVKVGNRFVAYDTDQAQKNALANNPNGYIFAHEVHFSVPNEVVHLNYEMSLGDINSTITEALEKNEIMGFGYYDENGTRTDNMKLATEVRMTTDGVDAVSIQIADNSEKTLSEFEVDVFGKTLTKVTNQSQNTQNVQNTQNTTANTSSDSTDSSLNNIKPTETEEQKEINKKAEEIAKNIKQENKPVEASKPKVDDSAVSADNKKAVLDIMREQDTLTDVELDDLVDESEGLTREVIDYYYEQIQQEKQTKPVEANKATTENKKETNGTEQATTQQTAETKADNKGEQQTQEETKQTAEAPKENTAEKKVETKTEEQKKEEQNKKKLDKRTKRLKDENKDKLSFETAVAELDSSLKASDRDVAYEMFKNVYINKDLAEKKSIAETSKEKADAKINQAARISTMTAVAFAKAQGKSLSEFMKGFDLNTIDNNGTKKLKPNTQGWLNRTNIYLTPIATPLTISHEMAHHFLETLDKNSDIYKEIEKTYGNTDIKEYKTAYENMSEAFAQGLERYFMTDEVINEKLRSVLAGLKELFKKILNYREEHGISDYANNAFYDKIFADEIKQEKEEQILEAQEKAKDESKNNKELVEKTVKEVAPVLKEQPQTQQEAKKEYGINLNPEGRDKELYTKEGVINNSLVIRQAEKEEKVYRYVLEKLYKSQTEELVEALKHEKDYINKGLIDTTDILSSSIDKAISEIDDIYNLVAKMDFETKIVAQHYKDLKISLEKINESISGGDQLKRFVNSEGIKHIYDLIGAITKLREDPLGFSDQLGFKESTAPLSEQASTENKEQAKSPTPAKKQAVVETKANTKTFRDVAKVIADNAEKEGERLVEEQNKKAEAIASEAKLISLKDINDQRKNSKTGNINEMDTSHIMTKSEIDKADGDIQQYLTRTGQLADGEKIGRLTPKGFYEAGMNLDKLLTTVSKLVFNGIPLSNKDYDIFRLAKGGLVARINATYNEKGERLANTGAPIWVYIRKEYVDIAEDSLKDKKIEKDENGNDKTVLVDSTESKEKNIVNGVALAMYLQRNKLQLEAQMASIENKVSESVKSAVSVMKKAESANSKEKPLSYNIDLSKIDLSDIEIMSKKKPLSRERGNTKAAKTKIVSDAKNATERVYGAIEGLVDLDTFLDEGSDLQKFNSKTFADTINELLGANILEMGDVDILGDTDGNLLIRSKKEILMSDDEKISSMDAAGDTYVIIPFSNTDNEDGTIRSEYEINGLGADLEDFTNDYDEFDSEANGKNYNYDARLVAEAYLVNLSDYYADRDGTLHSIAEGIEGTPLMFSLAETTDDEALKLERKDEFGNNVASIIMSNIPDSTLRNMMDGEYSILEMVQKNPTVAEAVSGLDQYTAEAVWLRIRDTLLYTKQGYTEVARRLAKVMTNENLAGKARGELIMWFEEAIKHATSIKDLKKALSSSLKGTGHEEMTKVINRIIDTLASSGSETSVSKEELNQVIRKFIDKDGHFIDEFLVDKEIIIDGENAAIKTNPIIELLNFANISDTDTEHVKVANSPEQAVDPYYIEVNQKLLKESQNTAKGNANTTANTEEELNIYGILSKLVSVAKENMGNLISTAFDSMEKGESPIGQAFAVITEFKQKIKGNKTDLNKANSELVVLQAKFDAAQKKIDEYKNKINDIKAQNKAGRDALKDKYQQKLDKLKKEQDDLKQQLRDKVKEIDDLKAKIDYMVTNKVFTDADQLVFEYNNLIKNLKKETGRDSRAVAIMLPIMEMFDEMPEGTLIDIDMFTSKWAEYKGALDDFAQDLEDEGLIIQDSNGDWLTAANLKNSDLNQLAGFTDAVNKYYRTTTENMKMRREAYKKSMLKDKEAIINDIRKFYSLQKTNAGFRNAVRDYVRQKDLASMSEQNKKTSKVVNPLEIEIMTNILKRECPALYAYFFGGYLDYEEVTANGVQTTRVYIKNNINTATDNEKVNTIRRKNALVKKISELFGVKEDDVNIANGRLFMSKTDQLGNMTLDEFEKQFGYAPIEVTKTRHREPDYYGSGVNDFDRTYTVSNQIPDSMRPYFEILAHRYQKDADKIAKRWDYLKRQSKLSAQDKVNALKAYMSENGLLTEADLNAAQFGTEGIESTYTMSELMGIYLYARQLDGMQRMFRKKDGEAINTNNFTYGNVLSVLAKFELNPEFKPYKELAEFMLNDMGSRYEETANAYYNITGQILDKIPNYFLIRDKLGFYEYEMGLTGQQAQMSEKVKNNSLKERGRIHPLYLNVMSLYTQAIDEQEHYIAFAELCDKYDKMFFSTELDRDEQDNFDISMDVSKAYIYAAEQSKRHDNPIEVMNTLKNWYDIIKNPGAFSGDRAEILSRIRGNMATSVLWCNISTVLQQFPTYVLVAKRVGLKDMMSTLSKVIAHPKTTQDFVFGKSVQMRDRARLDADVYRQAILDPESWFGKKFGEKGWEASEIKKKVLLFGLKPMETVDKWVANASWMAVYEWNLKNLERVAGMTDEEFDAMCVTDATQFVMDTNSSKNAKDNALIYSNRDNAMKSLLLFTSQMNKQFNMIYGSFLNWDKNGRTKEQALDIVRNASVLGLALAGAVFTSGSIVPKDDDDRDFLGILENFFKQMGCEFVGMTPFVGDAMKSVLNGDVYAETNLAGTTLNALNVIKRKAQGDTSLTSTTFNNALMSELMQMFELTGLPSTQIQKVYRAVRDGNPLDVVSSKWGRALE